MNDDNEEICDLSSCIEVFDDCVKIDIPNVVSIVLLDAYLDKLFYDSADLYELLDFERAIFWERVATYAFKLRENKREFYREMGFKYY